MPKIVDREAYRNELIAKAVDIFSEHGLNGLGMRGIAGALGVSKTALYHYFSSKEELFTACTEFVLEPHSLYGIDSTSPLPEDKEQAIVQLIKTLDSRFKGEMTVVLDYVKNRDSRDIANDELLKMADNQFLVELSKIVGREHANQAYALLLGGLMTRLLNGNQTKVEEIASWILQLSTRESS
ncbi:MULTISPECIES: TetR/AcrR family transcriptional regulator [Vibrio]|uniref:TetR family transcriptional regulator n=1 Tax=Vibrio coralliilyticus TaxID=190893 RepID=A0AAN0SHR5_9VIBR|nr:MULTISPECIES: TetR/AcrR family transcriptional regulator [Vibrio]AIS58176.1 TetR family transcriptional regulator [Vibrio coralliilyticus]AIW22799.1 TetR family transcriptional regulator [Vibrio coralliilyticus]MCM5510065.1 TetR/AcrR family transcriptional regulator [Vibrio sp. SCSIO 43169]NOH38171.1 TetR/AcrR family transcriptional regulator [Vibrio coralliilyticus]NOH55116.1 TetR/AcrR family transcriptional regulator [Vibrio coralliilyticus]